MLAFSRFAKTRTAEGMNRWDLLFDVLSYPVKLAANHACPTATLNAEITRTAISISERSLKFMSTYWAQRAPDDIRNYGYGKITNLLQFIPATALLCSGLYHTMSPIFSTSVTTFSATPGTSMMFLLGSMGLGIAQIDRKISMYRPELNFQERFTYWIDTLRKKNEADWITEQDFWTSFYSLFGTSLCVATVASGMAFDFYLFDRLGEAVQGCLQLYLGGKHIQTQSRLLTGSGMSKKHLRRIGAVLRASPEIDTVEEIKSIYLTSHDVKLFVSFKYNDQELIDRVIKMLEKDIENLAVDASDVMALRQVITASVQQTLTYTTEWREKFEADIHEEFDNVNTIDLELVKLVSPAVNKN